MAPGHQLWFYPWTAHSTW